MAASTSPRSKWIFRAVVVGAVICALLAAAAIFVPGVRTWLFPTGNSVVKEVLFEPVSLVAGQPNTLNVAPETARLLGIKTDVVKIAPQSDTLRLTGSLFLDANRRMNVHTRFAGEVVEIGKFGDDDGPKARVLRVGDRVEANEVLAVVWSKEIGEKKSDLVDSLSQKYLDQSKLKRLKKLIPGTVSDVKIEEAERDLEADLIAVSRAERTLRSWRIDEQELDEVRAEAERIHRGEQVRNADVEKRWAEVEIKAPFAGVILEKNIAVGDIVDTTLDLFKIANLSELVVLANVYEEDVPKLERLTPEQRVWKLHLKAEPNAPPLDGAFDVIGHIIDPNQHTAAITGWLKNPAGKLRVGQFITATIELPRGNHEVAVAESAVFEDGQRAYVFVSADAAGTQVTRREIAIAKRTSDTVLVKATPSEPEQRAGAKPLAAGERIVRSGVVLLSGALRELLEQHPEAAAERGNADDEGIATARSMREDHEQ